MRCSASECRRTRRRSRVSDASGRGDGQARRNRVGRGRALGADRRFRVEAEARRFVRRAVEIEQLQPSASRSDALLLARRAGSANGRERGTAAPSRSLTGWLYRLEHDSAAIVSLLLTSGATADPEHSEMAGAAQEQQRRRGCWISINSEGSGLDGRVLSSRETGSQLWRDSATLRMQAGATAGARC